MSERPIPFKELPLKNDFMFGAVFRNTRICQTFLEKLLGVKLRGIKLIENQKSFIDSNDYHNVRLDAYVEDEAGTVYDIEMQAADDGSLLKRAKRYLCAMERSLVPKGMPFDDAPATYVIFLCDYDEYGDGYAEYRFRMLCENVPTTKSDDDTNVIVLNSRYIHDSEHSNSAPEILDVLDYTRTADDSAKYTSELTQMIVDEVKDVRTDKRWEVQYVTIEEKMNRAQTKTRNELLLNLVRKSIITVEQAAVEANLSVDEFKKLMAENNKQ